MEDLNLAMIKISGLTLVKKESKLSISTEKSLGREKMILKISIIVFLFIVLLIGALSAFLWPGLLIDRTKFTITILILILILGFIFLFKIPNGWYNTFLEGKFSNSLQPIELKMIKTGNITNILNFNMTDPFIKIHYNSKRKHSGWGEEEALPPKWEISFIYTKKVLRLFNKKKTLFKEIVFDEYHNNFRSENKDKTDMIIELVEFISGFPLVLSTAAQFELLKRDKRAKVSF